jgi:hypothetical protein
MLSSRLFQRLEGVLPSPVGVGSATVLKRSLGSHPAIVDDAGGDAPERRSAVGQLELERRRVVGRPGNLTLYAAWASDTFRPAGSSSRSGP